MNFPPEIENPMDVLRSVHADMQQFQRETLRQKEVSMQRGQEDAIYQETERNSVRSPKDRPPSNAPCKGAGQLSLPEHPFTAAEDDEPSEAPSPPASIRYRVDIAVGEIWAQTVYMKEDGGAVCYYGNTSVGNLSFTGANPPDCSGVPFSATIVNATNDFTEENTFTAWWNQYTNCGPNVTADPAHQALFRVYNSGTIDLKVNGVTVSPSTISSSYPTQHAGYNTGNQSGFGGGTVFAITNA